MLKRILSIAKLGEGHWIACWYAGLLESKFTPTERLVSVRFRRIVGVKPEGPMISRLIGISQIGQVPLGSIWHDGYRTRTFDMAERTFEIDFTDNCDQIVSLREADTETLAQIGGAWPTDLREWHSKITDKAIAADKAVKPEYVQSGIDKSHLIKFTTPDNCQLLLPCLEMFFRLYGRSGEVKRAIAGYPWDDSDHGAKFHLYEKLGEERNDNIWKIRLKRRAVNGDVVFLAHAEYDPFTAAAVRSIHAQIVTHETEEKDAKSKSICFPVIRPWFEGPATLRVAGVELSETRFLGLRILGSSDPDGALIERDRVDRDKVTTGMTEVETDRFTIEAVRRIRRIIKPPIVDLTADEEPDHGSAIVEIKDDPFEIIGERRPILDLPARVYQRTGRAINVPGEGNETKFAGGLETGTGKGVGLSHTSAPEISESVGTQLGMWKALVDLKKHVKNEVGSVDWYTFADGFNSNGLPKQIYFRPFPDARERIRNGESLKTINWVYIDQTTGRMRGLVVMRIEIDGKTIYFIEQGRRRDETAEKESDKEEQFSGLVFMLDQEVDLEIMLCTIMAILPQKLGVMKHVLNHCQGEAYAYRHASATIADHFLITTKNALRKFEIKI